MITMNAPVSGFSSLGMEVQVIANNIANVNTHGFHASRVDYETAPYDSGVRVGAILRDNSPGPVFAYPSEVGAVPIESSNVNLVREFTNLISVQNAYSANAASLSVQDRISGYVIDLIA